MKTLLAPLILLLSMSTLAATQPLTIWHDVDQMIFSKAQSMYYQQTGQEVFARRILGENLHRHTRLAQALNKAPSAVILPIDQTLQIAQQPLGTLFLQYAKQSNLNVIEDQFIGVGNGQPMLFYYNKRLVTSPPETFDELLNWYEGEVLALDFSSIFFTTPFWGPFGAFNQDMTYQPNAGNSIVNALLYLNELVDRQKIPSTCLQGTCVYENFASRKAPFAIAGAWLFEGLKERLGPDLGVHAIPHIRQQPASNIKIPNVAVPLQPNKAADIKELIDFLSVLKEMLNREKPAAIRTLVNQAPIAKQQHISHCLFVALSDWHIKITSANNAPQILSQQLNEIIANGHCRD